MTQPQIPAGFFFRDKNNLQTKIDALHATGPDHLQLVLDFDRTLTVARRGVDGDITTWHILKEHLPAAGKARYQEFYEHYRTLELAGKMTFAHADTWFSSILDLYAEYGLNIFEIEQDFLHKATIRPYAKELLDLCAKHGIPTVILSAGTQQVIELWAQSFKVRPTIILSTILEVAPDGTMTGWRRESLIHTHNKKEMGHGYGPLEAIRRSRNKVILVGDSLGDADMAEGEDDVLRIRIHDPRADEKSAATAVRDQTLLLFDAMIETGSLRPLHDLVKQITG
jgi:HAD superfamily phosphoserine phosphatase-like hydrolase